MQSDLKKVAREGKKHRLNMFAVSLRGLMFDMRGNKDSNETWGCNNLNVPHSHIAI